MTLDEVKQFFADNKDDEQVKQFLSSLSVINPDKVKEYLTTDEGKRLLQPVIDSAVTKGIETYKEKTLPGLVDSKVKELYPAETPEQKRIREQDDRIKKLESDNTKKELRGIALQHITENKLPFSKIVDKLIGNDQETTIANITTFGEVFKSYVDNEVTERLKGRNPHVNPNPGGDPIKNPWSKEHFNLTEQGRLLRENPELAKKYMAVKK